MMDSLPKYGPFQIGTKVICLDRNGIVVAFKEFNPEYYLVYIYFDPPEVMLMEVEDIKILPN